MFGGYVVQVVQAIESVFLVFYLLPCRDIRWRSPGSLVFFMSPFGQSVEHPAFDHAKIIGQLSDRQHGLGLASSYRIPGF